MQQQLSILKGEIRNYKQKMEEMVNFSGKIENFEDFKVTLEKVLENYKPKKKEYEELVKKLKDHIGKDENANANNEDNMSVTSETKKKKGFLGLFKKNK